ncbi:MAG: hypothetical protein JGK29_34325 [Microcoleus sp. PH2017_17_BER_D_A]|nr:hypothetical protein [Microcoleus sp. PH2017_17_BER_D_A]
MQTATNTTNWNWYGMWFWDYLNLDRDDFRTEAWEAFDIWKQAYTKDHPDLADLADLDLVFQGVGPFLPSKQNVSGDRLETQSTPGFTHPHYRKPMNTGRSIANHIAINEIRRKDILEILKDGPKTAYKISLKMPGFYSTGTTMCRLRELQAAGKVTNFGDVWEIK